MVSCAYPVEVVALFTMIPLIAITISLVILWYYATRSAESLTYKIMNIGGAVIIDAFILSVSISLFYTLSGCGP
jgi:hypothetical protein